MGSLKDSFPMIYALEIIKKGPVANFGRWSQGVWHWEISLRRQPLEWKIHTWEDFTSTIGSVCLDENSNSQVVWKFTSSRRYSFRSLRRKLIKDILVVPSWKLLWSVSTPLKIRSFIWLFLLGILTFRDRLARFEVIPISSNICSFCRSNEEDLLTYSFIEIAFHLYGTMFLLFRMYPSFSPCTFRTCLIIGCIPAFLLNISSLGVSLSFHSLGPFGLTAIGSHSVKRMFLRRFALNFLGSILLSGLRPLGEIMFYQL